MSAELTLTHVSDKPRILVVDDEEAVRKGLAIWLGKRAFEIVLAHDLRSAANAVVDHRPDAVLLDVRLGTENGLHLVEWMGNVSIEVPVVILTAHAGPYEGFRARDLGVAALIEKPSSPDEIASILRRTVETTSDPRVIRSPSAVVGGHRLRDGYVVQAVKLVHRHFGTKGLSLGELARSVGVSSGYLGSLFRREMGCSIVDYIHRSRVVKATHLLETSHASVKVIAEECGYHGPSELDRHFQRQHGMSPTAFRRRLVQDSLI